MEGKAEIFLGEESRMVMADQSVVIPAEARHGFKKIGSGILKDAGHHGGLDLRGNLRFA